MSLPFPPQHGWSTALKFAAIVDIKSETPTTEEENLFGEHGGVESFSSVGGAGAFS